MVFASFVAMLFSTLLYVGSLFVSWLYIFISPLFKFDILWIIVPIWLTWFFTEFFQESKGTALGNAITNGAITLWVGIDLTRYLVRETVFSFELLYLSKIFLCTCIVLYGVFIVHQGLKKKSYVRKIGRVRETTYFLLMFSPVVYGILEFSLSYFLAVFLFFPVWYFGIEFVCIKMIKGELTQVPPSFS
ncbi:MAG: hypothetical protein ACMXYK_01870 [Candidatus Woesearchaeota archaeon]